MPSSVRAGLRRGGPAHGGRLASWVPAHTPPGRFRVRASRDVVPVAPVPPAWTQRLTRRRVSCCAAL
ncbi:protein of unknown function [Blastococcus saxobsidens DD2]|uniref:Uncharacterized protein n=1 Tax=Blastococcus saxobsidens (strain DD2) TaxID=1146883 RepID=H6RMU3_BLASD|nr:protein of unknown function [Blastococcus saxobsidens DD2]